MTRSGKIILGLIIALGFILRFTAVNFGLPHLYHADEPIVVNHALAYGSGDFNPHFFKIPPLVSYLLFLCYGIFFVIGKTAGLFANVFAFENFFYADPTVFYLIARIIFGVLAGTYSVYLLYKVFAGYFKNKTALTAAFFFAVCFLHVRDSHYVYADIPLCLVVIWALGTFLKLQEDPSFKSHLISGSLIGLAAAFKYNGAALVFPYLAASFLSPRKFDIKGWLSAGFISIFVFLALNPFSVLDFHFFRSELATQSASQGGTFFLHHFIYSLAGGLGWPMLGASLLGLSTVIFGRNPKTKVLAVFAGAYYIVLVLFGQPYDRYALPLIPVLVFFAADITVFLTGNKNKTRIFFLVLGLLALSIIPLAKSIVFDQIMTAKDTRTLAKEWIEQNIPANSRIALDWDFFTPRLNWSTEALGEKTKEVIDNPGIFATPQLHRLKNLVSQSYASKNPNYKGYQLFFLTDTPTDRPFLFSHPAFSYNVDAWAKTERPDVHFDYVVVVHPSGTSNRKFLEQLRVRADLVIQFSPFRNGRMEPYDKLPLTGGPFLWSELWHRERNGLPLEIYKMRHHA